MTRPGPLALRLSDSERQVLEQAARRRGVPMSTYIKESAMSCAVMVGITLSPEVSHLIRQQAGERGIDEHELAALVLQAALALPRP